MKITIRELKKIIRETTRDTASDTGSPPAKINGVTLAVKNYPDLIADGVSSFVASTTPGGELKFSFSGVYPEDGESYSQENTYQLKIVPADDPSDALGLLKVLDVSDAGSGKITLSYKAKAGPITKSGEEEVSASIVGQILDKVQFDENFIFPLEKKVGMGPLKIKVAVSGIKRSK